VKEVRNEKDIRLDISGDNDCESAIEKIQKEVGRIDVLINNAGYTISGKTCEFGSTEYLNILNVNVIGAFRLIKKVVPTMKKQKSGRIINITSLNGLVSLPNFGLYSSSKFALDALGVALRYELAKDGIWITNVAPGAISSGEKGTSLPHKPAREKLWILKLLMPMISREEIAGKIEEIIRKPNPPSQVVLGNDAKITYFLQRFLPSCCWDRLMFYVWNKK
jgi:short-subunit dehydrogenase